MTSRVRNTKGQTANRKPSAGQTPPRTGQGRPTTLTGGSVAIAAGVAALLVVLVVAAFAPCLKNGFVAWDDDLNFVRNPSFLGLGWSQLGWAWTTFRGAVYQPLAWILLEAQSAVWGLQPRGYHLTSLVLHAVNTIVLLGLVVTLLRRCRLASEGDDPRGLIPAAGLAVALFAVHPLRVEVVAWASCQPYLPCALFTMLAVLAYLRAVPEGSPARPGWLAGSWLLFAAALLSKAVAVTLPAVLVILDVYPLRRLGGGPGRWFGPEARRVWREKVPFAVLSLVFLGLAVAARERHHSLESAPRWGLASRFAQGCYATWLYLGKTVWPADLAASYPVPERAGWTEPPFLVSVVAILGVTAVLVALRRRWPGWLAAWLSYLVILAPNSGVLRSGRHLAADRYTYLATIGGVALAAAGLFRVWQVGGRRRGVAVAVAAAGLGAALGLIPLTRDQCRVWGSSEALWTHALTHGAGRSALAHNNLGVALFRQGKDGEARRQYLEALRLDPGYAEAHNNLGAALLVRGDIADALAHFNEAARLNPHEPQAENNRAMIWATHPEARYRDGRRAIAAATRACELTGWANADFLDTLAAACAEAGDFEAAVRWQTRALDRLTRPREEADFRARLELYRAHQPYHAALGGR